MLKEKLFMKKGCAWVMTMTATNESTGRQVNRVATVPLDDIKWRQELYQTVTAIFSSQGVHSQYDSQAGIIFLSFDLVNTILMFDPPWKASKWNNVMPRQQPSQQEPRPTKNTYISRDNLNPVLVVQWSCSWTKVVVESRLMASNILNGNSITFLSMFSVFHSFTV